MNRLSLETCIALKEAGFPQNVEGKILCPNLSELIEACGNRFSELNKMTHKPGNDRWTAIAYSCENCGYEETIEAFGSTADEAVAHLYLLINKKKDV